MKKYFLLIFLLIILFPELQAQYTSAKAHSHNDYLQKKPFLEAYLHYFGSVEADIWAIDGELYVAHSKKEIASENTLDALYIQPIVKLYKQNNGKAWPNYPGSFQLIIELKSDVEPTLSLLINKLQKYPEVFDRKVNSNAVLVVITGNRPSPALFANYPDFIQFDGKLNLEYNKTQRNRIALFSEDLAMFTSWKGQGNIPGKDQKRLLNIIDSVHTLNCKIRFWNAPDTPNAWEKLMYFKVDYINTDHIADLANFIEKSGKTK
jgi:alkaline phosphatase